MANHACMNLQIAEAQPLFCKERFIFISFIFGKLENKRPALLHGGERGGTKRMERTLLALFYNLREIRPILWQTYFLLCRFEQVFTTEEHVAVFGLRRNHDAHEGIIFRAK